MQTTDPTGLVTSNTYEPTKNNLVTITVDPLGLNITAGFTFDAVGNTLTATDANGNVTTSVFDSIRRVTQVTGSAPFNQVTYFTYDNNGNVVQTQSLNSTDPNSQIATSTFAIDGKVLTQVGPINYAQGAQPVPIRYAYDNLRRLSQITDPMGHLLTTVYDALSRPLSSAIDGVTQQALAYTTNGQLLSTTDARNNTTQFQYDGFDRPTLTTYPDSTYEQVVSYDSRDNILQATTRAGDSIQFTYDALNQRLTKAPSGQPTVSYSYDLAGRTLTVSTPLVVSDPSTGTTTLFYDTAGRMFKEQYPDGKLVVAGLDKNGNLTRLTYPDGNYISNTFDALDRLTNVSGFGGSVAFGYDSASRRSSQVNSNGTGQGYSFDKGDSLLSITTNGLRFSTSQLGLPQVILAFSQNDRGQTQSRQFNDSRFIWQPSSPGTITYGTANNVNEYPSVNGVPFSYNANGCLTNDGTRTYGYDVERRLLSVTGPSSAVSYKYDPLGRLVQKTVGATTVRYLYSGMQRIEEYSGSGTLLRRYVYGDGLDECLFVLNASTGSITYLHGDEAGSTILTTDPTGTPIQINTYSPWGELASGSLSDISIGFTGQFYDPDTGLYYFKARHYSPGLGRFLQPDPIGYDGGLNLYEYAASDPINSTDPLGLDTYAFTLTVNDFISYSSLLYPGFAGFGAGSGPGGSLDLAQAAYLEDLQYILNSQQSGLAAQQAAIAAEQQAEAAKTAQIIANQALQAALYAAAVRRVLNQSVDPTNQLIAANPFDAPVNKAPFQNGLPTGGSYTGSASVTEMNSGTYTNANTLEEGQSKNISRRLIQRGWDKKDVVRHPMPYASKDLREYHETTRMGKRVGSNFPNKRRSISSPTRLKKLFPNMYDLLGPTIEYQWRYLHEGGRIVES